MGDAIRRGHDRKWDKLVADKDGALKLPAPEPAETQVVYFIGKPGSEQEDAEMTYAVRMFNKYKWLRVPARDTKWRTSSEMTGKWRFVAGSTKLKEYEYRETLRRVDAYVLVRQFEVRTTDLKLQAYYDFVTGAKVGTVVGSVGMAKTVQAGVTLGGTKVRAAILGARAGVTAIPAVAGAPTAATAATVAGAAPLTTVVVGLADAAAAFIFTTTIMQWIVPSSRVETEGWLPVTSGAHQGLVIAADDVQIRYVDTDEICGQGFATWRTDTAPLEWERKKKQEEREALLRSMRYEDGEYERTHRPRPAVEWSTDEAYQRQRALDSARARAR